jgi:peptidoglycan-associated lipoprotein
VKHPTQSATLLVGATLALSLVSIGCARRAVEAPPEPASPPAIEVAAPMETEPPAVEPVEAEVSLPPDFDPAYFDFDSYALDPSARSALDRAAKVMRDRPELSIVIEGHCDERGTTEYNLALGERRASAARDHLMAAGVSGGRIRVISFGEERPFAAGGDEAAWAQNRRAHVVAQLLVN